MKSWLSLILALAAPVALLAQSMPGVPVIAEEASAAGEQPAIGARFMLVDPLDGTKEFISRNGEKNLNKTCNTSVLAI